MTRNSENIVDYPISSKNTVDTGIQYSSRFGEWEACVAAGLDIWRWEHMFYDNRFKAYVVKWYELHRLIETHENDAQARKTDQESRGRH